MSNYIPNNEHFLKRARNIRDGLLNRTDRFYYLIIQYNFRNKWISNHTDKI